MSTWPYISCSPQLQVGYKSLSLYLILLANLKENESFKCPTGHDIARQASQSCDVIKLEIKGKKNESMMKKK